jgi:DNA-binding transcriptional MerR regulator
MVSLARQQVAEQPGEPAAPALIGRWPHALSQEPLLRVSDVLGLIVQEFPALTTSKLRFYDSQGLVSPERTASGYRLYSAADVERLRFVLRQQRDHYRPLTVIAEHLLSLDRGTMIEPISPHLLVGEEAAYLTPADLAARAGVAPAWLAELEDAGVVAQAAPGAFDRSALDVVVAARAYVAAGGDVRSLRTLSIAAKREGDMADAVAAPTRARGAAGEADEQARERAEAAIAAFSACVRATISR